MVKVRATRSLENAFRRWGFHLVAGCDEVGRGCLAGPVVAGAVILATQFSFGALFSLLFSSLGARLRRTADNVRAWREERRRTRQRREVLAKHGKKDLPEPVKPPKVARP